ncbi:MAG TPA: Gfo/Idh/MocA family oxidoreductase [Bryobacteraceae bacterium]|jgi:predicted dehydrogenase|nr:Gfo/Idh/MocA family oxidoreductase [Bryobacteraceae bacterium]
MPTNGFAVDRRGFLRSAGAAAGLAGLAKSAFAAPAPMSNRVLGANDRIQVGVIGTGGRGTYVARVFSAYGEKTNACQIVGVCDVYEKRKKANADRHKCPGYSDYRELLERSDIDAVIVATPDHWHAPIAVAAMKKGKDVYLEKPMCHTNDEIKLLVDTVRETKRVVQVGSQTTTADQWWKARKAIQDGMIGDMIMSQGSYHRNSIEGEWNYDIDADAGPDAKGENHIDWKTWLGPAPERPWSADRFFRFRKFWDYSGGIATDLYYHVVAPLQICWGEPQFPYRVGGFGGVFVFKDTREVPDTFQLVADYAKGHSLVLTSSMANSQHIPGIIRGHAGTIIMVDHGEFERPTDHITVIPEVFRRDDSTERAGLTQEYTQKFGTEKITIPVDQKNFMEGHVANFLECMHTREKPHCDVDTGARAMAVINLSVQSYRENRVLFWDEKNWKAVTQPPAA